MYSSIIDSVNDNDDDDYEKIWKGSESKNNIRKMSDVSGEEMGLQNEWNYDNDHEDYKNDDDNKIFLDVLGVNFSFEKVEH